MRAVNKKYFTKIKDLDMVILSKLSDEDLFNFCLTNKYVSSLCNDETFWRNRFLQRFNSNNISSKMSNSKNSDFNNIKPNKTWKSLYLFLSFLLDKITLPNLALELSAKYGNIDLVNYFIGKGGNDLEHGLSGAAEGGHIDLINFFINKGAKDWMNAMLYSSKGGHEQLVKYFINKNNNILNLEYIRKGVKYSALGGNMNLINFFVSKEKIWTLEDWKSAFLSAVTGGNINVIQFFIDKGVKDWEQGLLIAAREGHLDLVKFFASKEAKNWGYALRDAILGRGNRKVIEYLISKGAINWETALATASKVGDLELVKFFLIKGAKDWRYALQIAKKEGKNRIVKYLEETYKQ